MRTEILAFACFCGFVCAAGYGVDQGMDPIVSVSAAAMAAGLSFSITVVVKSLLDEVIK